MPEIRSPLAARYAIGRHPADAEPGITLREIAGWDLVQAACWRDRDDALHAAVEQALGMPPPSGPNRCSAGDGIEILTVAPKRLWCLAPAGDPRLAVLAESLFPETGCTTQLGHSQVRLRISGPATRNLLAQEIAIDLAPAAFPASRIARTSMHQVPVLLQCIEAEGDGVYDLYLPHTYAASTWEYLLDLASAHGCEIAPRTARDGSATTGAPGAGDR